MNVGSITWLITELFTQFFCSKLHHLFKHGPSSFVLRPCEHCAYITLSLWRTLLWFSCIIKNRKIVYEMFTLVNITNMSYNITISGRRPLFHDAAFPCKIPSASLRRVLSQLHFHNSHKNTCMNNTRYSLLSTN